MKQLHILHFNGQECSRACPACGHLKSRNEEGAGSRRRQCQPHHRSVLAAIPTALSE